MSMSKKDRRRSERLAWKGETSCDDAKIDFKANTANVLAEADHQGGHRRLVHGN